MTETDTTKKASHAVIKQLGQEKFQLDFDDKLFYDFLRYRMDALLRKPQDESVNNVLSYSKWKTRCD